MKVAHSDDGYVYTRYITRNGKRIYHPRGGLYRFKPKVEKPKSDKR